MAGKRISGITLEINGDTIGLNKALKQTESEIRNTQTQLKDVERLLKLDPKNTELLAQKQKILKDAVGETKTKLDALKEANKQAAEAAPNYDKWKEKYDPIKKQIDDTKKKLDDLKENAKDAEVQLSNGEISQEKYKAIQDEIKQTSKDLRTLQKSAREVSNEFGNPVSPEQYDSLQREIIETEKELKSLEKQARLSNSSLSKISEVTSSFGKKVESAGKSLLPLSAAVGAAGGASVKFATDIESAMTGVRKTVDATEEQFSELRKAAEEMSQTKAISQEDILGVMELGGQLGIAADDLANFAGIIADLDISTNLDAETASTELAQFANITGMTADEYKNFGDTLVALGNNSATTEADIMNMAMRIAGAGTQIGMTEDQILAMSASLSSVGIEAEAGGTAISTIMSEIDKSVALGSEKMNVWAQTAGMSAEQFKNAWETDAAGAMQAVLLGMNDAQKGGENLNLVLSELGVESIRQTDAMKRLSNNAEGMAGTFALANEEWANGNALSTEAGKQYETTAAKMQQTQEAIKNAAANIGEILLPVIKDVLEKISGWIQKFNELDEGTKKIILIIAGVIAAIGPFLITIGKVATGIGAVTGALSKIGAASGMVTKAGSLISTALGFIKKAASGLFSLIMAHPVIAVITAIIAAVVLLYTKCEWFRDAVHAVLSAIASIWKSLKDNIVRVVNEIKDNAMGTFKKIHDGIKNTVSNIVSTVKSGFGKAVDFIKELPGKALTWGRDFIKGFVDGVKDKVSSVVDSVKGVASTIASYLHFSRPDVGPLRPYETWPKDFLKGYAGGIEENIWRVQKAASNMAEEISLKTNNITSGPVATANYSPNVTVMIGNREFDNYIVKTSMDGINRKTNNYAKSRGY